jgi:hypothetical protein
METDGLAADRRGYGRGMRRQSQRVEHPFSPGQEVWLRGQRVVFLDYIGTGARIRRTPDDVRVVPAYKLALDRRESLALATTIPAAPSGTR